MISYLHAVNTSIAIDFMYNHGRIVAFPNFYIPNTESPTPVYSLMYNGSL